MEGYLLGSISPINSLRNDSIKYLQSAEKQPNYIPEMISLFNTKPEEVKILSLISIKNCIQKYWLNPQRIPDCCKDQVKLFLISNINEQESFVKFIRESIITINKFDYLDTWKALLSHLSTFQLSQNYLVLLHSLTKTQLRKGSSRSRTNLKDLFSSISPFLLPVWLTSQESLLEKLVMKLLIIDFSSDICSQAIGRAESYFASHPTWKLGKIVIKGLNQLVVRNPPNFEQSLSQSLSLLLKCSLEFSPKSQLGKEILETSFSGLREILLKHTGCIPVLLPYSDKLIEKTLEVELDEKLEIWSSGDYEQFVQSTEEIENDSFRRFQETLIRCFPHLLSKVTALVDQSLTFMQVHTLSNLYGILSKFQGSDKDYQIIISKFSQVQAEGFEKLVLYRDLLILTKKWLNVLQDFSFVYQLLLQVKNNTSDWMILYECCLVLKQITYQKVPADVLIKIVSDFGLVAFDLISQVQSPSCVWHLTSFISNLIESSESNEVFIKALKDFGLQKLIVDENEMTVQSIGDMLEKLLVKNKGNNQINEAFSLNLQKRLMTKDKEAVQHWLTFLVNFQGDLSHIEGILPYFPLISNKLFVIKAKIAEEYLLIYFELGLTEKIQNFFDRFLRELSFFTRDFEQDALALELLFCISTITQPAFQYAQDLLSYLNLNRADFYELTCIQNSLLIISRFIISNTELMARYNLNDYLNCVGLLAHHNHLTFAAVALGKLAPFLNSTERVTEILSHRESEILQSDFQKSIGYTQSPRFNLLFITKF